MYIWLLPEQHIAGMLDLRIINAQLPTMPIINNLQPMLLRLRPNNLRIQHNLHNMLNTNRMLPLLVLVGVPGLSVRVLAEW